MNNKFSHSALDLRIKALEIAQKLLIEPSKAEKTTITSQPNVVSPISTSQDFKIRNSIAGLEKLRDESRSIWSQTKASKKKEESVVDPEYQIVSSQKKGCKVPNPSELRIFVKNLSNSTTEDKLKSYFGRWGVVSDVCIRKPDRRIFENANMAFITFASFFNESPMKIPIHIIEGRSVPIHLIGSLPNARYPAVEKSNSVMITGAIHCAAEGDLVQTFSKFGKITKITRKMDPATGYKQYLRYAFIVFNETSSVDKIIGQAHNLKVNGQVVDVRRVKNQ